MTVLPPGKLCGHALQGLHNKPKLEERWHLRLGGSFHGYLEVMDGFPAPGTRNSPPQRGEETPRRLPAEQAAARQVWGCSTVNFNCPLTCVDFPACQMESPIVISLELCILSMQSHPLARSTHPDKCGWSWWLGEPLASESLCL
ncbi:uncharacterized protein LOC120607069 isoform X3 [Pteropus medius]|uniref:uncharacterized protein LOC120607069 isoform X3 n=1 Tax=Pteropus vampyrus TaxID=132908 RepID=UPI00196B3AD5|nr:uncharacterized protein LOC120607069 isoform X3 [Pteropus giganteus]